MCVTAAKAVRGSHFAQLRATETAQRLIADQMTANKAMRDRIASSFDVQAKFLHAEYDADLASAQVSEYPMAVQRAYRTH